METHFPFADVMSIELTWLPLMLMSCFQFPHNDKIFLLSFMTKNTKTITNPNLNINRPTCTLPGWRLTLAPVSNLDFLDILLQPHYSVVYPLQPLDGLFFFSSKDLLYMKTETRLLMQSQLSLRWRIMAYHRAAEFVSCGPLVSLAVRDKLLVYTENYLWGGKKKYLQLNNWRMDEM